MSWKVHIEQLIKSYQEAAEQGDVEAGSLLDQVGLDAEDWLRHSGNSLFLLDEFKPRPPPPIEGNGGTISGIGGLLPKRLGRFEILGELGRGGGGVVLLAGDPFRADKVALKIPRPEILIDSRGRRRFIREAQVMEMLRHPALLQVYEVGYIGPICYIVSAYAEGPDLAKWLDDLQEPVSFQCAAALIATLAEGVAHAHEHGVFHRDIKPSNILLDFQPGACEGLGVYPKLSDFGLAKLLEGAPEDESRSGTVVGTPRYMPPEQAAAIPGSAGPLLDVYALGAILYELLVGSPPYEVKTIPELLARIAKGGPVPPRRYRPEIPKDLETIALRCLAVDPRDRCQSAADVARNLRLFNASMPIELRPTSFLRRQWARFRRLGPRGIR